MHRPWGTLSNKIKIKNSAILFYVRLKNKFNSSFKNKNFGWRKTFGGMKKGPTLFLSKVITKCSHQEHKVPRAEIFFLKISSYRNLNLLKISAQSDLTGLRKKILKKSEKPEITQYYVGIQISPYECKAKILPIKSVVKLQLD